MKSKRKIEKQNKELLMIM